MESAFSRSMARLRRERGLSQRKVAEDLHISQALISHYEKGLREPGLNFVCLACDYYGVTADYLLGRTQEDGDAVTLLSDARRRDIETIEELLTRIRGVTVEAEHVLEELRSKT